MLESCCSMVFSMVDPTIKYELVANLSRKFWLLIGFTSELLSMNMAGPIAEPSKTDVLINRLDVLT